MLTAQGRTNRALRLWQTLPADQQAALLEQAKIPCPIWRRVIQLDTTHQEQPKVVSAFFEMDLCINSRYVYLFDDEL